MTALHCPLPSCGWTIPLAVWWDPGIQRHMDALSETARTTHLRWHPDVELTREILRVDPATDMDGDTLSLSCPIAGCRWGRVVALTVPGFWAGLFRPAPTVAALLAYADRDRHLSGHGARTLAGHLLGRAAL